MNLFNLCCDIPWLITPQGLQLILQVALREDLDPQIAAAIRADREARPSAVEARAGRRLDGTSNVYVRDGIAIMHITGPIVRYADFFSEISGAASVETLATDFEKALNDPGIDAILLTIDSPGGEVTGIHDFGEQIYQARNIKPIWAYVEGLGASAAYWLASATSHIVADPTAALGSIGVVMSVRDPSKVKATDVEIVSSQSPNKRPDVTTEKGRGQYQRLVDDLAAIFVETVARNRAVDEETVLADFGQGGVLIGKHARTAKLADEIGGFEDTLAALRDKVRNKPRGQQGRAQLTNEEALMSKELPNMGNWSDFWKGFWSGIPAGATRPVVAVANAQEPAAPATEEPAKSEPAPVTEPSAPATEEPAKTDPAPATEPAAPATEPASASDARLAALQAEVSALRAEQKRDRHIRMASQWYGATDKHLQILAKLDGSPEFDVYVELQNAAAKATGSNSPIFLPQGVAVTEASTHQSAWDEIEAKAQDLVKTNASLSIHQAISQVIAADPQLYERYRNER